MRADLFPCPGCARHVRRSSTACPFCRRDVVAAALRAPWRRSPRERLGRAATFAFGAAALSAAGCSSSHQASDAGDPARDAGRDAFVSGDAVPVYGGPDAPLADAPPPVSDGGSDAAGLDANEPDAAMDAGDIAIYGGPPPPGE